MDGVVEGGGWKIEFPGKPKRCGSLAVASTSFVTCLVSYSSAGGDCFSVFPRERR